MEQKEISQAVVGRLPRYLRYLGDLKDEGVERISSQELSELMQELRHRFVRILIISVDSDSRDMDIM